jgi:ubiquinone/menaquinone biosynthesis C-methylase UbiE
LQVNNYKQHYKIDAEEFDYFDENNKFDNDYNRRLHRFILKFVEDEDAKLLDIGSGGGWITKESFNNIKLTLCDLSSKNLDKIKERQPQRDISYIVSDALNMPFKDNHFNYVILSEVLEHINDPLSVLKEIYRITDKGGKIIISTPYKEKIQYYLCIHCNKKTPANAHLHSFDEKIFTDIFKKTGIEKFTFHKIGNKFFLLSRISYFLRFLPFWLWRVIDKVLNLIFDKPMTIVIEINK